MGAFLFIPDLEHLRFLLGLKLPSAIPVHIASCPLPFHKSHNFNICAMIDKA